MKYHREGCTAVKHQADVHGEGTTLGIFGDGGEDTISPPEDCPGCYWERVVLPWFKANFGFSAWCVVNSANYGTPQKRERVILMAGPKHPIGWGDPWPTETHSLQELVGTKNDGRYWARHGIKPSDQRSKKERKEGSPGISETESKRGALPWLTVRDAFSMLPPEVNGYESLWVQPHQVARTEAFRSTTDIAMNPDMPSDTVTCRRGGAKTNDALIWNHDGRLRYLTLAEVASLQAFPPDHPWQGSKSAKYKQVGNAVPPPVAEALGRVIVSALK
jgi:DNA (cytosine-5)-methyltransferase 1